MCPQSGQDQPGCFNGQAQKLMAPKSVPSALLRRWIAIRRSTMASSIGPASGSSAGRSARVQ
jgi:hypothetical protein